MMCDRTDPLCTQSNLLGVCVPAPEACSPGDPVCGCDGQTYASDCDRLMAGVAKKADEMCDPPPAVCGSGKPACQPGYFCEYPDFDCGEGLVGVCVRMRSEPCNLCMPFVDGPVCGCNFQTFTSDCERQAAGVSKYFNGSCS